MTSSAPGPPPRARNPGSALISGTGSNVFGVGGGEGDTPPWRAGGWGHLLGDEGSGYWLGAQSIAAVLHDRDGSGPPTALSDASLRFFGAPSVETLAASVYTTPLTKSEVAAFAIETSRLAGEGDAVARELYARAAGETRPSGRGGHRAHRAHRLIPPSV